MPYAIQKRRSLAVSVLPPFTHVLGPGIAGCDGQRKRQALRRMDIQAELAGKLPRLAHFSHACHPGVGELLGFQASGFETFVQFSAEIAPAPQPLLWSALGDKTRNVIRRASEAHALEALDDPLAFTRFYRDNLALAGDSSYVDFSRFPQLWDAVRLRRCGLILAERNPLRELTGAAFFAWDSKRLWYVLSTRHPGRSTNGTISRLVWEGILEAGRRGLVFDFHGIASEGAARFYAGFGARITPRFAIHSRSPSSAAMKAVADLLRGPGRNHFVAP